MRVVFYCANCLRKFTTLDGIDAADELRRHYVNGGCIYKPGLPGN